MKLIFDYVETLRTLGISHGYIPVTRSEWDDLMEDDAVESPVIKEYGDIKVTIELIEED